MTKLFALGPESGAGFFSSDEFQCGRCGIGLDYQAVEFADCPDPTEESFLAGFIDNFALPPDPSSPSPELVSSFGAFSIATPFSGPGFQDFDLIAGINGGSANTQVAYTFEALPAGIVGASLELRVRAGTSITTSDGIILSFVETSGDYLNDIAYARTFGSFPDSSIALVFPEDPGLVQPSPWLTGNEATFTLDLSALPLAAGGTLDLIPDLNSYGFLDVLVDDETGVDYMILTVEACPTVDPPDLSVLETITIPVDGSSVTSTTVLENGVLYRIRASGTFIIGGPGDGRADAEYADFSSPPSSVFSRCGYQPDGLDFGIGINDPVMDADRFPFWGDFNPEHVYEIDFVGEGAPLTLNYHDCGHGDNSGSLTVELVQLD